MRIHKPRNPARRLSDLAGTAPARRPAGGVVRAAGRGRAEPSAPRGPVRAMPKPRPGPTIGGPGPIPMPKPGMPEARPMPKPSRRRPPKG